MQANEKEIISTLSTRLLELVKERKEKEKISQNEQAQQMGVKQSSLTKYINGGAVPTATNLYKIAEYFNCSIDYLLGLANRRKYDFVYNIHQTKNKNQKRGLLFKSLREEKGCTQDDLAKLLNISKPQISTLETGKRTPSVNELIKYSQFFKVPMESLLGISAHYESIEEINREIVRRHLKAEINEIFQLWFGQDKD